MERGPGAVSLKRLCCHPGCVRYAEEGTRYCPKHQEEHKKPFVGGWMSDYTKSFYNSRRWRNEKAEFLKANPYCVYCGRPATDVHHEWPAGFDYHTPEFFFDHDAWQSVCFDCHQAITKRKMMEKRKR